MIGRHRISASIKCFDMWRRGGFTLRLLRKRMTEQERQKFDAENGIIIEE
jgi:Uncharacterized protein conserved in bacteria (DUF2314)